MSTQEDRLSAVKAATDRFHEAARELAFFPKALERSDFACFEPFISLAGDADLDGLYGNGLWEAGEADPETIRQTLRTIIRKEVGKPILVSKCRRTRPWETTGLTGDPASGTFFEQPVETETTPIRRLYRRGSPNGYPKRVGRLYYESIGKALCSNIRGTFIDSMHRPVYRGLEGCLQLTLFGLLTGNREVYDRLAAALPVLRRCAPLAEHPREPGTWYVFVR